MPLSATHANALQNQFGRHATITNRKITVDKLADLQMRVVLSNSGATGGTDFTPNEFGGIVRGRSTNNNTVNGGETTPMRTLEEQRKMEAILSSHLSSAHRYKNKLPYKSPYAQQV